MMQRGTVIAAVTAALVLGTLSAQAAADRTHGPTAQKASTVTSYYDYSNMPDSESAAQMKNSIDAALETHKMRMRQASKEITEGVHYTARAQRELHSGDLELARQNLEAASKLFSVAMTNDPDLDMVPVADAIAFDEFVVTPTEIKERLKQAETAIREHRTQEARVLLMPLTDQMTVTTEALPMGLYPDAVKRALAQLRNQDKTAAEQTLRDAFSMIVTEEEILPLPLLKAQVYADAASRRHKAKKKEALVLIGQAEQELERAVLLGYANADDIDYKRIGEQLAKIRKNLSEDKESVGLFETLKHAFETMLNKTENGLHKTAMNSAGK